MYIKIPAHLIFKRLYGASAERNVRSFLLGLAALTFGAELLLFLSHGLNLGFVSNRFIPETFLDTINFPLTLILIYEVYLLVGSTAHSIIEFISKQFEVVALIILRTVFKDLSHLSGLPEITIYSPLLWTIFLSMAGSLLLYFFIEIFERYQEQFATRELSQEPSGLTRMKEWFAVVLGGIFLVLTVWHGGQWMFGIGNGFGIGYFKQIFSVLVIFDIGLLIVSMRYFQSFTLLFEYSAFILASVLVLIALPLASPVKILMVIVALLFCVLTVRLHGFTRENEKGDK